MYTRLTVVGALFLCAAPAWARGAKKEESNTDAATIGVLLESNGGEVDLGQSAAGRVMNPDVAAYALRLAEDHYQANMRLLGVAQQIGIQAEDSALRRKKVKGTQKELDDIWMKEPGQALDQRFVEEAVKDHTEDLKLIDKTLLPNAKDPQLAAEISQERGVVAEHLRMACDLQESMGGEPCKQLEQTETPVEPVDQSDTLD
jgi:putative membrane protein